jgi:hypothetical protein
MTTLDGHGLYHFFKFGSHRVRLAREALDRINVFPVPDRDTGSNIAFTLSGAVRAAKPADSAAETLNSIADGAILSARGNSGVIFAQFIAGMSEAIGDAELRMHEFADAVHKAYLKARAAVSEPKDGTMLSVIKDWAAALSSKAHEASSFSELIEATKGSLKRSLESTTQALPELRDAGVVDAGAAGFVEFVEGAHEYLKTGAVPGEIIDNDDAMEAFAYSSHADAPSAAPRYRYCAEAIVEGAGIDAETVRAALSPLGDSLIVAGGARRCKVHVHTDDPEAAMAALSRFGAAIDQKADDMLLQFADSERARAQASGKLPLAIVTDSSCDLPRELLDRHRIHVAPLNLSAGGSEYLDKLTISPSRLREFSEGSGTFPKSSQVSARSLARVFEQVLGAYESAIAIHLSAAMSGTYEASKREAERAGGRVSTHDSRHLSGSLALIVLRAAEAIEAGMGREEIMRLLPEWSAKARILVSVTSLRYMVRGGRVSPLKGFVANALNLKPIVSTGPDGKSVLYGKAFSERANLDKIVAMTLETHRAAPLRAYMIGHAGAPEKAAALAERLERELGFPPRFITEISAVVALNSGPGAVSVAMMSE